MIETDVTPEALAHSRRTMLLGMEPQDFMVWRHNTVTAAFLQYLEDQIAALREGFADMLEAGTLSDASPLLDTNPHAMRGQLHILRRLHGLDVFDIHRFYGKEQPVEEPTNDELQRAADGE